MNLELEQEQGYVQVLSQGLVAQSSNEDDVVSPVEESPVVSPAEESPVLSPVEGNTVNEMALNPKRHRARWTNTEVAHLHREFRNKANSVMSIALGHQRTHSAILYKLESEGLLDEESEEEEEESEEDESEEDESEEDESEEEEDEEEEEEDESEEEEDESEEEDEEEENEEEEDEEEEEEDEEDCIVDVKPLHSVFMYCKTAIGASYHYCRGFFFK